MAVIQKIRNKYGKLAGGLIALSLVGFILMDAASSRFSNFFGSDNSIAKVNGSKIEARDFSARVKEYESIYATFGRGKNIDENTRAEINNQAVENMVYEKVVEGQCEKLGLETTKEEEKDIIYGSYPDAMVQQYPIFTDPETNTFNPQRVKAFEQQANKVDPSGKMLEDWMHIKSYVVRNNTFTKFTRAITATTYVPKFVIQNSIKEQEQKASIRFVKVPYISIADNEVKVTDEEINAYMQAHPGRFMVPDNVRGMEYVSFDVIPSADDSAKVLDMINKAKTDLAAASDKEAENVVNRNSDERYVEGYANKRTIGSTYADSILSQPVGTVYGPYMENSSYKIVKVLDKQQLPDTIKGNIILMAVSAQGKEIAPDSIIKKRMDSVVAAAQMPGADFKALAEKYSDDKYTKTDGKFTYSLEQKAGLPKHYSDFIFNGKPGDKKVIRDSTESFVGYFYAEIQEVHGVQTAAKLAVISKELLASEATQTAAYAKANEFAGKNTNAAAFDETAKKDGYNKKIAEGIKANDFTIGGVGPAREMVRWLYEAKIGDVSQVFTLDNRYIVAKMTSKQDKGLVKLDEALRPRIEAIVKQDKKYKLIAEKYKSAGNIEALAQSSNAQVQQADSFSLASGYVPNLGYEPKVLGFTFSKSCQDNAVSPGIQGGDGVFFISRISMWNTPLEEAVVAMIANNQRAQMEKQQQNNINQQLRQALIEHADVKYNPKNM